MKYTITTNTEYKSTEITFDGKPSQEIRDRLKSMGFRWHRVKMLWYGYKDAETVQKTLGATEHTEPTQAKQRPQKSSEAKQGTPQEHIKFYWNGIKVDGGKLIKCAYSLDNNKDRTPSVSIYVHDYSGNLPRDLFEVRNDTDIYTDYFDTDSTYITPVHPLYKYVRYVAEKARARYAKKIVERMTEQLKRPERWSGQHKSYKADIAQNIAFISAFESMKDPGQPTAEDLAEIDRRRQEAENAKREAEHLEELKQREIMLGRKANGQHLIESEAEAAPIVEGDPVVIINWSEHPAFYSWEDDALRLSVKAAERILKQLDAEEAERREGGYYKTKFTIIWTNENGESSTYTGRYDLGDGDGGLLKHIRSFGEWHLTHDTFGREKAEPETTNDIIKFADYLESYAA